MDLFEQLRKERGELLARLSKIESVLTEHAALQRKVGELLGAEHPAIVRTASRTSKPSIHSESSGRRVSAEVAEFERAIHEILSLAPRPLDRTDLLEICVKRNIHVGGKDPINTLASRMTRMVGVTNVRGQGYFLESRLGELYSNETMPLTTVIEQSSAAPPAHTDVSELLNDEISVSHSDRE